MVVWVGEVLSSHPVLLGRWLGAARTWVCWCAEPLKHIVRGAVFLDDEDDMLEGPDLGRGRRRQTERRQRQRRQPVHAFPPTVFLPCIRVILQFVCAAHSVTPSRPRS